MTATKECGALYHKLFLSQDLCAPTWSEHDIPTKDTFILPVVPIIVVHGGFLMHLESILLFNFHSNVQRLFVSDLIEAKILCLATQNLGCSLCCSRCPRQSLKSLFALQNIFLNIFVDIYVGSRNMFAQCHSLQQQKLTASTAGVIAIFSSNIASHVFLPYSYLSAANEAALGVFVLCLYILCY